MLKFFNRFKDNPILAAAIAAAVLAFFGIIIWFYSALDAQMRALEAGVAY